MLFFAVLYPLHNEICRDGLRGRLALIHEMNDTADRPERFHWAAIESDPYPRPLLFPHFIELAAHDDELVDRCYG